MQALRIEAHELVAAWLLKRLETKVAQARKVAVVSAAGRAALNFVDSGCAASRLYEPRFSNEIALRLDKVFY